jgi:hypothetical protein
MQQSQLATYVFKYPPYDKLNVPLRIRHELLKRAKNKKGQRKVSVQKSRVRKEKEAAHDIFYVIIYELLGHLSSIKRTFFTETVRLQ